MSKRTARHASSANLQVFSAEKSLALTAPTRDERESWYHAILQSAVRSPCEIAEQGTDVAPVWVPDNAALVCVRCREPFTVLRRRHHCRHCGALLCAGCSEARVHIAGLYGDKAVRVCKQCYAAVRMKSHALPPGAPQQAVLASTMCSSSGGSRSSLRHRISRPSRNERRISVREGRVVQSGWLQTKSGGGSDGNGRNWARGGRSNWKSRWVVVTDTQFISWYNSEEKDKRELKGSLGLHGAQMIAGKREGAFWVLTNTRSLELRAESTDSAKTWIRILQQTANMALSVPGIVPAEAEGEGEGEEEDGSSGEDRDEVLRTEENTDDSAWRRAQRAARTNHTSATPQQHNVTTRSATPWRPSPNHTSYPLPTTS